MVEEIKKLEVISMRLEPDFSEREVIRNEIIKYTEKFLENLPAKKAYAISENKGKGLLNSPISEAGTEPGFLVDLLEENVDKPGLNPASAGHLGYIPGGGLYTSALGDYIAAITNRYAGVFFASPGAVRMEKMMVDWMCKMINYPQTSGGTLTSGGSVANLIGIVTARDAKGIKARDVEKSVIYTTSQAHHSIEKAVRISGLGEAIIRKIELDQFLRMDIDSLEKTIHSDLENDLKPFLIVASMGTTDTGAIDPIDQIGEISSKYHLWFHLDAAYGGFFMLCDEIRKKVKGIDKADSIVMDPHKSLFIPYGLGAVLVKNEKYLSQSQYYTANYMQDTKSSVDVLSPSELSPELSRHFRGMRMWLPLKLHGVNVFRAALEEKLLLAKYFHKEISEIPGIELFNFPELSVVAFRYIPKKIDPDYFNKKLIEEIQKDGRVFLSSTMINNKFTLRLAVVSFRTHLETVKLSIEIIKAKISELEQSIQL